MKSKVVAFILLVGGIFFLSSFVVSSHSNTDQDPWKAPAKYEKMKNPVKADAASINVGKSLWGKHCKSCHGKEGLGDGPKSEELDTPAGDFTSDEFQGQTDGSIFYKSWFGRDEMPNFEKKIPDEEDIWHLVNFMRSL